MAQSLPEYDSSLLVYFATTKGKEVFVKGPKITYFDGQPEYDRKVISNDTSPDGEFLEVHYLGSRPKYWDAHVYLVSPYGKILDLSNGMVRKTQWTEDSQYLLGFGDNTIRIWNMSGKRRQISFGAINSYHYVKNLLCIDSTNYGSGQNAQEGERHIEVYSIPTLAKLPHSPYLDVMGCHS